MRTGPLAAIGFLSLALVAPAVSVSLAGSSLSGPPSDEARSGTPVGVDTAPLCLLVTGDDRGYLEPCGCSRGQLGGIARRHTLLQAYVAASPEQRLLLSNGGLVKRSGSYYDGKEHAGGPLDRLKVETTLLAMDQMGYDALNLAPSELAVGRKALAEAMDLVDLPLLAGNLVDRGDLPLPVRTSVTFRRAGRSVLVLGLMSLGMQEAVRGIDHKLLLEDPLPAARRILDRAGPVQTVIVLLRGTRQDAERLLEKIPAIDLVIIPGSTDVPEQIGPSEPEACIVTTGHKAKFVGLVKLPGRSDPAETAGPRFEVLPVSEEIPESPDMLDIFSLHIQRLDAEKILEPYLEKSAAPAGGRYVGASRCADCHDSAHQTWSTSRHASSWPTLVKAGRTHDPDCVPCHVTGFGFKGGFFSPEHTPDLAMVSCEACHGPGENHISAVRSDAETDRETPYQGPYQGGKSACETCHDHDHSPEFDHESYWLKITHDGE